MRIFFSGKNKEIHELRGRSGRRRRFPRTETEDFLLREQPRAAHKGAQAAREGQCRPALRAA